MLDYLSGLPLIAILRGLEPQRASAVGHVLFDAGFHLLEVPLNRPGAIDAMRILIDLAPPGCIVGAGTVLTEQAVDEVAAAGGKMIVSPNFNAAVIGKTKSLGLLSLPGVATPSEAFGAIEAGADALKIFPADSVGIAGMQAWQSVLPSKTVLLPVGGITPDNIGSWRRAGARGAGIGGALFQAELSDTQLRDRARLFVQAWQDAA